MCEFNPSNAGRRIDPCMRNFIEMLNINGIKTLACCCGHGKYPMSVVYHHTKANYPFHGKIYEMFSMTEMTRKKRFYKRDVDGYYYIPETVKFGIGVKYG